MRRIALVCLAFGFAFISATCSRFKPFSSPPEEIMKLKDYVYYHNVSITYDGKHYFTINGGNDLYFTLNEYDREGNFIRSYDLLLDGRAIFYNPIDHTLYLKDYGSDLYRIMLKKEDYDYKLLESFEEYNSSPAISPDGSKIYEFIEGTVRVLDFYTGEILDRFFIEDYYDSHGYNMSIAASEKYLFIWGDEKKVLVYDLNGRNVGDISLPRLGFGFSLSYCNDMLWIAEDADAGEDGGYGYWFGYKLK